MPSLLNPYVLLFLAVAFAATAIKADSFGYERALGEVAKRSVVRTETVIVKANETADQDTAAAVRLERQIQQKRQKAQEARHALELDIERKARKEAEVAAKHPNCPARSCDLDYASLQLLRSTIRLANDPAQAPGAGQPAGGVPADPRAAGRPGGDHPALERRPGDALR